MPLVNTQNEVVIEVIYIFIHIRLFFSLFVIQLIQFQTFV